MSAAEDLPEYVQRNRAHWDDRAAGYVEPGRKLWSTHEISWGIWGIPESEVHLLPQDVSGMDVIELGCGTAYVSAWLAKRGAKPVGIDNSPRQLEAARGFQQEFGIEFPLMLGNAETVPLPDASFDLAVSEYGAALYADPYKWIPEAARLLRPGGQLAFMSNSAMVMLCIPDLEADGPALEILRRPYFGMHRTEWPDSDGVEFHLTHGDWIRLLRANGFEIDELIEFRPPENASSRYDWVSTEWARKWPSEEGWKVRKRPEPGIL
jgi:SAM-dependent methyltransferase